MSSPTLTLFSESGPTRHSSLCYCFVRYQCLRMLAVTEYLWYLVPRSQPSSEDYFSTPRNETFQREMRHKMSRRNSLRGVHIEHLWSWAKNPLIYYFKSSLDTSRLTQGPMALPAWAAAPYAALCAALAGNVSSGFSSSDLEGQLSRRTKRFHQIGRKSKFNDFWALS